MIINFISVKHSLELLQFGNWRSIAHICVSVLWQPQNAESEFETAFIDKHITTGVFSVHGKVPCF